MSRPKNQIVDAPMRRVARASEPASMPVSYFKTLPSQILMLNVRCIFDPSPDKLYNVKPLTFVDLIMRKTPCRFTF